MKQVLFTQVQHILERKAKARQEGRGTGGPSCFDARQSRYKKEPGTRSLAQS